MTAHVASALELNNMRLSTALRPRTALGPDALLDQRSLAGLSYRAQTRAGLAPCCCRAITPDMAALLTDEDLDELVPHLRGSLQ